MGPPDARFAIVASPRGVEMADAMNVRFRDVMRGQLQTPALVQALQDGQRALYGDAPTLAASGFDAGGGMAVFVMPDEGVLAVLPRVDRARFVAARHAHTGADGVDEIHVFDLPLYCAPQPVGVYACASARELLGREAKYLDPFLEQLQRIVERKSVPIEVRHDLLQPADVRFVAHSCPTTRARMSPSRTVRVNSESFLKSATLDSVLRSSTSRATA